ncbi:MAG TPA: response regulator [Candidatus Binatia bacterium]|nr:response regulator [Candidatus Binatia bacterium]
MDRPRVLIVDDELGVRESLRAILMGECDVLTASNGQEALELIGREPIDVMTLDLKMPGLGGMRVLEHAKEVDPDIEVLIITGYGSFDTAVEGLRFKALDYLAKPFDSEHVRRLVATAVARRAEARRLKRAPEQVLSTLSHQFRTPLNAIVGYSTMLTEEMGERLSEEQRLALERIQSNSADFLGYVETLFYLNELANGLHPAAPADVRLGGLLEQVAAALAPQATAAGVTVRCEGDAALVVATDADKVFRLLRALADNAVKATPAGRAVVLRAERTESGAAVEIEDGGPGLAPDLIAEAMDEASGARARVTSRLGFGLRLAARLARVLGATLSIVASADGTRCRIALPPAVPAPRATSAQRATA